MLIVNYQKLEVASALADEKHPLHEHAKEYDQGLKKLRKDYPEGHIRLLRVGYPKLTHAYTDGKGHEYKDVPEEIPPMRFSLRANVSHPQRGKEQWAVCLGAPYALPGGLWDIGGKLDTKTKQITSGMTVDLVNEADLAFFLYYKCPHVLGGHWKVDDPRADVRARGDVKRKNLERETAIWQSLSDDNQLRTIAAGWGIEDTTKKDAQGSFTKEGDAIRIELESLLERNDEIQKRDPSYRGTKEFLEDMKITDVMRLNSFIQHWMDEGMITYKPDGRYRVGDKILAQVPQNEIVRKKTWLFNYYASPNQTASLQELMKDLINKEYLDSLSDVKDFRWIAGVMKIEGYYNKPPEQVKEMVYSEFVI